MWSLVGSKRLPRCAYYTALICPGPDPARRKAHSCCVDDNFFADCVQYQSPDMRLYLAGAIATRNSCPPTTGQTVSGAFMYSNRIGGRAQLFCQGTLLAGNFHDLGKVFSELDHAIGMSDTIHVCASIRTDQDRY